MTAILAKKRHSLTGLGSVDARVGEEHRGGREKKKLHLDRPTLAREKVGKFSNHSKCGESSSAPKRVSADPLSLCHVTYSSTVLSRVYSVRLITSRYCSSLVIIITALVHKLDGIL